jgi:hypothetical protein
VKKKPDRKLLAAALGLLVGAACVAALGAPKGLAQLGTKAPVNIPASATLASHGDS